VLADDLPLVLCDLLVHATLALGLETIEDLLSAFFMHAANTRVLVPQHWRESSESELPVGPFKRLVTELRQTLL
jgi:hypothetical protein